MRIFPESKTDMQTVKPRTIVTIAKNSISRYDLSDLESMVKHWETVIIHVSTVNWKYRIQSLVSSYYHNLKKIYFKLFLLCFWLNFNLTQLKPVKDFLLLLLQINPSAENRFEPAPGMRIRNPNKLWYKDFLTHIWRMSLVSICNYDFFKTILDFNAKKINK